MKEKEILERLKWNVVNYNMEDIFEACKQALKAGISPQRAILEGMARGMDIVGEKYSEYEYFLPDLIMAAEVMNEGTRYLMKYMEKKNVNSKTKIVIGTVEGDIHDIGKNIVANLLQAKGFYVVDLGINVPAKKFVDAVEREKPKILAISALLSTTRERMKDVVEELKKRGLRKKVKVMIGGVLVDSKFAEDIGADAYARDAVVACEIAKRWLEGFDGD